MTLPRITLGTRSGVQWVCYREPRDTDTDFAKRLETMRAAFLGEHDG